MANKIFPHFERYTDYPTETAEDVDHEGTMKFLSAHPEYFACPENAKLLESWLYLHNELPFTLWNLQIAMRDLQEDNLLQTAPAPEPTPVDKSRGIILARSDALREYQPSDAEVSALEKLKDVSSLNDRQRKNRDEKLRLLAGEQRRALAKGKQ